MEQFNLLLSEKNEGKRKESSLEVISNNIRRLYIRCYDEEPEDISQIEYMINDVQHTFACLQSPVDGKKLGLSTMLSYTNSLLIANDMFGLQHAGTYANLETELQVRRADAQRKNPVKETKINRIQLDTILSNLKDLPKTKTNNKTNALFQIISKYPFRLETATLENISQEDYDAIEDKGVRNFLIDGKTFAFYGYKTNKKYGTREIEITDEDLLEALRLHLETIKQNDFIFFNGSKDGTYEEGITIEKIQAKQRNNLSLWIKRYLKKQGIDASATDITKLLISEVWDFGSTQDKIQFALFRGHTTDTASKVYATAK
tara:strand:+ start:39 stop:989 length:951 start_codon:yes stop_codon:yes gene_type:complete